VAQATLDGLARPGGAALAAATLGATVGGMLYASD